MRVEYAFNSPRLTCLCMKGAFVGSLHCFGIRAKVKRANCFVILLDKKCVFLGGFRPRSVLMGWSLMGAGSEWIFPSLNEPIRPLLESTWVVPHSECFLTRQLCHYSRDIFQVLFCVCERYLPLLFCVFSQWWWWWRRWWQRRW